MINTKVCSKCKRELPLTNEFWYADKSTTDGWYSSCKECKKDVLHNYHRTEMYRRYNKRRREKNKESRSNHRKKMGYNRIHKRVERRINKTKTLKKCPICWKSPTRIVAHHPDYDKRYEVVFCCLSCHQKIHRWKVKDYKIVNIVESQSHVYDMQKTAEMPIVETL